MTTFKRTCIGAIPILLSLSPLVSAATIYVKPDAGGNGSSWAEASALQTALTNAASGDEIWVAKGVYKPTDGTDRTATFQLINGVALFGGFTGTETARDERDWNTNKTVLSGDIDNDDTTHVDGIITNANNISGYNVFTVVTNSGTDNTAILDGFVITGGFNVGYGSDGYGSGMYNEDSVATLTNLILSGNATIGYGAGMYNVSSSPTLTNVTFSSNTANESGGGMYNNYSSNPTLTNVTFSSNAANNKSGGGMYNNSSSPTLTNVTFSSNTANNGNGGGMYNNSSSPTLTNVVFYNNSAQYAGGIGNSSSSDPILSNVTLSGNSAQKYGGGIYNQSSGTGSILKNVIVWGNTANSGKPQIGNSSTGKLNISYSLIQDGCPSITGVTCGDGNITSNPLFVNESNGDLRLSSYSPAIDVGDKTTVTFPTDIAGNPRIYNNEVDFGAYEYDGSDLKPTGLKPATMALFIERNSTNPLNSVDVGTNSIPIFADLDKDGDLDAVIGESDSIINYYENTGTALVEKTGTANPFDGIVPTFYSSPALVDIDNDGDLDAFLGNSYGTIVYYKNTGTSSSPTFVVQNGSNNPFDGVSFENGSTPTFVDIDKDGDLDTFIGENEGTLNYFENTGTVSSPIFVERLDTNNPLNNIDVGYLSNPRFVDIDHDGDFDAFIGEEDNFVNYYENVGTARHPYFTRQVNPFVGIYIGEVLAPTFVDWDKDGDWDAFIGESEGTIRYYENLGPVTGGRFLNKALVFKGISVGKFSAAFLVDIDNDGDKDAFIGEEDGVINFYKNTGTQNNPLFVEQSANPFDSVDVGASSFPAFVDIDADGDIDAFIGEINGTIKYYQNTGTATNSLFEEQTGTANPLNEINLGTESYAVPSFVDIDQDGDLDVFIGHSYGTHYYRNVGTSNVPDFVEQTGGNNPLNGIYIISSTPNFIDFDADGDFDAFIGEEDGNINYFENTGTASNPNFVARTEDANPFVDVNVGEYSTPFLADIDNDGSLDALIGEMDGTIQHYEYTRITNALPHGGDYNFAPQVYLKGIGCDKFYYTLNGSTPTTSSTQYASPIAIPADTTTILKYISVSGGTASEVTTETYFVDTQAPTVTITVPEDQADLASLPTINGTATDVGGGIGVDYTEVQMKNNNNLYLAADGGFISTPTWLQATGADDWSYDTSSVTFPAGNYTITARTFDKLENIGAELSITVGIAKGFTGIYLESDSATILNDAELTLVGKLNRFPETTEDLSNLPIVLTIIAPGGTSVEVNTLTHTDTGQFRFDKDTANFPTFSEEGAYSFQAKFAGDEKLVTSESSQEMVLVGASAGYAILVQGKIQNEEGLAAHKKTSNRIYKTLKERGFEDDNLYYFNYSDTTDKIIVNGKSTDVIVRGKPTKAAIAKAFTDLQGRMNSNPASLYVIMIDHGGVDGTFHIYDANNDPNDNVILPSDIDNWLDTLEAGLSANAKKKARLAILGYCYSGSFISELSQKPTFTDPDDPKTLVDAGRIIITSATAQEESYKGPEEPDGVRSGEFFMEEFFTRLNNGDNIKQAFEFATEKTEAFTRKGGDANSANRFYDEASQHPLLDDNGDGKGSNSFTTVGDSQQAQQVLLGMGVNYDTNFAGNPAEIMSVSSTIYLGATESTATLEAKVNNASGVNSAPVDIRKPSVILSSTGTETCEQLEITNLPRVFMACSNSTQSCLAPFDKFIEPGKYEAFYFVRDAGTNDISPLKRSVIYKNYANNLSPSAFELVEPTNGSEHKITLIFKWNLSTDADSNVDNPVTYNLILSEDENFSTIAYQQEELETAMTYVDDAAGLEDQTTYYWKVEAVDPFGERTTSSSVFSFTTNNTNAPPGIGSLHISSALDFRAINGATISLIDESDDPLPDPNIYQDRGNYNMLLPRGRRRATIHVDGYEDQVIALDTNQGTTRLNVELIPTDMPLQPGKLQFMATTANVDENKGTATILVGRVEGSDTEVTVDYTTADDSATAGSDYTSTSGTLTWIEGDERAKPIYLPITDDQESEGDETLTITLSNPTGGKDEYLAELGETKQITVTIKDDEAEPEPVPGVLQFSSSTYSATESDSTLNLNVNRTEGSDGVVSVQYIVNGTATLNADYTGGTGRLTWSDGDSTAKSLNLSLIDDNDVEETESLSLTLFNLTGDATLGNPAQATLSIADNDAAGVAGTLQFSAASYTATEGETATINVNRGGGSHGEVSVQYLATGESTAMANSDYSNATGTLTWADGESSTQSFTVTLIDDQEVEENETLQLMLSNPTGGVNLGSPAQTTLSLIDNDKAIAAGTLQFSTASYTAKEGDNITINVTRTDGDDGEVSINYASNNGSAIEGRDYFGSQGTLTWADQENLPKPITISLTNDTEPEPDKTFQIILSEPAGSATLGNNQEILVTIIDDDQEEPTSEKPTPKEPTQSVQFSSKSYTANEGNKESITLTVTRTGNGEGAVSVKYLTTADGTADFNDDYTGANSGTLTWANGDSEPKLITLNLIDDEKIELSETAHFMLFNATGNIALKTPSETTLTIVDNDRTSLSLGQGMGISTDGTLHDAVDLKKFFKTRVLFWGGAKVKGQDYTTTLFSPLNQGVKILGEIHVDPKHVGETADILVVASVFNEVSEVTPLFLMLDNYEQTQVWDGDMAALVGLEEDIILPKTQNIEIFHRFPEPVRSQIYFGYRLLEDGFIYFNGQQPIEVLVEEEHEYSLDDYNTILFADVSRNGKLLVTASKDGIARLWDLNTGSRLALLRGHTDTVKTAMFGPHGKKILTASADHTARLWDVANRQKLVTFQGHTGKIEHAAFSPNAQRIITASADKTARIWNANNGETLFILEGHEQGVQYATFNHYGDRVVTTSWDHTVRLWDAAKTGEEIDVLVGHEDMVEHAAFSPNDQYIVTTSWDKTARLWDAEAGQEILTLNGHRNGVSYAAFCPKGEYIVTTSWDNSVRLWDVETGEPVWVREHQAGVHHAAFSPNGQMIVTGSNDHTVRLWKTATGQPIKTLQGHEGNVWHVGFSPDGERVFSASWDNSVRVWEVESGEVVMVLKD